MPVEKKSTEDEIADSLGIGDDGVDTVPGKVQGGQQDEDGDKSGEEPAAGSEGSQDKGAKAKGGGQDTGAGAGKGGAGDGKDKQGKGAQGQGDRGPKPLLDANGKPIVQGGAERRLFEKFKHAAEITLPGLQKELDVYKKASSFASFELSAAEAVTSYQIMQNLKKDPGATIKYLLTKARAQGHTIDLGDGAAGIDMAAIKAMISEATKPLSDASAAREQSQKIENEARAEWDAFQDRYEDAATHEAAIAQLLQKDEKLSLDAAYFKLRTFYVENGLDWSKPLQEHIDAAKKGQVPGKGGKGAGQGGNGERPRTQGRGGVQLNGGDLQDVDETLADASMPASASYEDIIRKTLRDNGHAV